MNKKVIVGTWWFTSVSKSDHFYETLQYSDATTSCGCLGWTRRVDENGNRSCRHTRMVDAGVAHLTAHRFRIFSTPGQEPQPTTTKTNNPGPMAAPGQRKLIIE